jgi:hypothetical protein
MPATLHLETTVLPGHRLEVTDPHLPEGSKVELIVVLPDRSASQRISMVEFLSALPTEPSPRCFRTWDEYKSHLREEKDLWER